jgi:YVTN family beta-propeller protein
VTKLNLSLPGSASLVYSSYLGGSSDDSGNGIAVDATGNAYVTGSTNSTNFPTTPGAFQTSNQGSNEAFVAKINMTMLPPRAYVANARSNTVSVIDPATNTVVATVPVGRNPVDIAITPDGTKAYVTNAGANSVSVINTATNSVAATVPVGQNPVNVALR